MVETSQPSTSIATAAGAPRPEAPPRAVPTVPWWGGALALLVGGIGAQIAGVIPVLVAGAVWIVEHGGPPDPSRVVSELIGNFWVLGPSILLTGLTMTAVAVLTTRLFRAPLMQALALRGAPWPVFIAAPIGILALGPTSELCLRFMQEYFPGATFGAIDGLSDLARSAPIYLVLPAMALVPGFCEEILFRGLFQNAIRDRRRGLVLSAVLFAAYHTDPHHVAAVLPLGLYLAWLMYRTKSLAVTVTSHTVNNAVAVLGSVYLGEEAAEQTSEWWWAPIGWVVFGVCAAVVWRTTRKKES